MEERIIKLLRERPGLRKRVVANTLHIPMKDIIAPMYQMCYEGKLRYEVYKDLPNMEYYEKYYVMEGK
jgi:hypothetical protein